MHYCILQGRLHILAIHQTADQACCKGIAAAYTVNDRCDVVLSGVVELTCLSIHNAGRPAVIGSAVALAQRADDILEAELISHLVEDVNISSQFQFPGGNVRVAWLEAQDLLSVLFVADAHVNILHQVGHDLLCFFRRPQFLTEVQVNGYGYAVGLAAFKAALCQFDCSIADSPV